MPGFRRILLGICALAAALAVAGPALGARPFAVRYTTNTTGGIASTANTLMTCPAIDPRCADAQAGRVPLDDNDFSMVRVDIDGNPATFDSSRARLTLPPTATVLFAALYVTGDTSASGAGATAAPNRAARGQAKLLAPGDAAYRTLNAIQVDDEGTRYQSVFDVTPVVSAAGGGSYTVADVQTGTGNDRYGGWTIIVLYRDPTLPARNLTLFDGYVTVNRTNPVQTLTLSGFRTPPTGPVSSTVGLTAYEGDAGATGDTATLDATPITDAFSPANNVFNSTITTFGAELPGREPSYRNNLGFDADVLREDGVLRNGATSASVRLTTAPNGETYFTGAVTVRTDLFAPTMVGAKTRVNLTTPGDEAHRGDTLRYTVRYQNTGLDAATGFVLGDAIPPGTDYVPGSLRLVEGPGAPAALSDAPGDDQGEFGAAQGRVVVRAGTGAGVDRGGRIPPGGAVAATFDVRVQADARDGDEIANQAEASFLGESLGNAYVDVPTNEVSDSVSAPDLAVDKSHEGQFVAGQTATFFINVRNAGSLATDGSPVTVADTLPADAFTGVLEAAGDGWACQVAGLSVSCSRSDPLAPADSYPPIRLTGRLGDPLPPSTVNLATVAGGGDSNPGNNTGLDVAGSIALADLRVTKTPDADTVPSGAQVTYRLVVTNEGPSTAGAVVLDDPIDPAAFADVTVEPPAGSGVTCTAAVHCDIGALRPGSSVVIPVTATVTANDATLVNTATVASTTPDPTPETRTTSATIRVPNTVDVAVTKQALAPTATIGGPASFRVLVSNAGPGTATGVVVRDRLPAGFQLTGATGPGVTCTPPALPGDNLICLIPTLAAGAAPVPIDVSGTIAPSAAGQTLSNGVEVASDQRESDTTNNAAGATLQVLGAPDVQLFKQALTTTGDPIAGPLLPGARFVYRLAVTNAGPGAAPGVTISDPLPAGVTFVAAGAPGCAAPGGVVTCTLGTLADGAQAAVDVTVQVAPTAAPGTRTNAATVTAAVPDGVPGNNTSSADVTLGAAADLSLVKTVSPGDAHVGDLVTYTVTVTNHGPGGTGATVTDVPPPGLALVSGPPGCSFALTGITCPVGDLAPGESRTLTVVARILPEAAGHPLVNRSTVSAADGPTLPRLAEFNPGDESAGATVNVAPVADLRLAKSSDAPHIAPGAQVTYTLSATNGGPDPATGVVIQDVLPAGAVFEAASDGCQEQAGVLTCQVGDVAVGETVERTVVVRALRGAAGTTLVNAAAVSGAEDDLDPGDNVAQIASPAVDALVDLSMTKVTSSAAPGSPGQVAYTITVGNGGPSPATGVTLRDPLPDGLTAVSAQPSQGSCTTGADVTCALGTIEPGGAAQAILTVQVPAGLAGRAVVNRATVTSAETDETPGDNAASVTVTPQPGQAPAAGENATPGASAVAGPPARPASTRQKPAKRPAAARPTLALGLRSSRPAVRPGQHFRLTAVVHATGHGTAQGAVVCVGVPAGLSVVRTPAARDQALARACRRLPPLAAGRTTRIVLPVVADPARRSRTVSARATLDGSGPRRRAAAAVSILTLAPVAPAVTG